MRISAIFYCLKQGLENVRRNIWFSLASASTIAVGIFLFCLFFSIISNVRYIMRRIEGEVGITVLFDEGMSEADILSMGVMIGQRGEVKDMAYISAQEAWESFKKEYFAGNEELAEGFSEDNPLADSASFSIYLNEIADQAGFVEYLEGLDGVRQVNYSNVAVDGFAAFNRAAGLISVGIIGVLLAVSVFLIGNTISVAAAFRRQENRIMRLIGASNMMIGAPFLAEGLALGLAGAIIPLAAIFFLYRESTRYLLEEFRILPDVVGFLPITEIFPQMAAVSLLLGVGIGFLGSFFAVRRSWKV